MALNELEEHLAREHDSLKATLERSDDWDEACHAAVLRYANILRASGLERETVARELADFTIDTEHAAAITYEAETGERLPFSPEDDHEDEEGIERDIQRLALVQLLFGLAFLSLGAYRVYLIAIDQTPLRFASVLIGVSPLVVGLVIIRWGLRSIRAPHRI